MPQVLQCGQTPETCHPLTRYARFLTRLQLLLQPSWHDVGDRFGQWARICIRDELVQDAGLRQSERDLIGVSAPPKRANVFARTVQKRWLRADMSPPIASAS